MPPSVSDTVPVPPPPNPSDVAVCRAMLRTGSRTFHAASLFLPAQMRDAATALYAFCRMADDAVDLGGGGPEVLEDLRHRLDLAYGDRPYPSPVDRAFAAVAARYAIPRALPEALIEGFAWDAEGRRYETIDEVRAYGARVAGTVGAMMALLMGVRDPAAVARATDLGVAMQLSNIARDVGEDARNGRLYLPRAWMREAGIDPDAWMRNPVDSPALASVVRRLLAVADGLYTRSEAGIAMLPSTCRPGIYAARFLYCEIGREVEKLGADMLSRRAVVPGRRKLALLLKSALAANPALHLLAEPPLPETAYLVEAVGAQVPAWRIPTPGRSRLRAAEERLIWLLTLFERLERLQRAERMETRHRRHTSDGGPQANLSNA